MPVIQVLFVIVVPVKNSLKHDTIIHISFRPQNDSMNNQNAPPSLSVTAHLFREFLISEICLLPM